MEAAVASAVEAAKEEAAAALEAAETARRTFEEGAAAEGLPTIELAAGRHAVVDLLVASGLAASKGEAKRLIKGGGAKLDDGAIADEAATVEAAAGATLKLSAGKKRHALVKII